MRERVLAAGLELLLLLLGGEYTKNLTRFIAAFSSSSWLVLLLCFAYNT